MTTRIPHTPHRLLAIAVCFMVMLACIATSASAATHDVIKVTKGKSQVIDLVAPASRVSIAAPETADIILLSPTQIYLTAKEMGSTTLTVWNGGNNVSAVFDIQVVPDISGLKAFLHHVLPAERDIKILAMGDRVTLAGQVSSTTALGTALDVAQAYAPEKVTNLLSVGGVHQVMLEVKVAEMQRTVFEKFGIDLSAYWNDGFAFTMLNKLFSLDGNGPIPIASPHAQKGGAINMTNMIPAAANKGMMRFSSNGVTVTGFLDVLKQNGLVKMLAEPTLICRSGEDAQFLAGGEIPIPVPQGLGTVAIKYKKYGVSVLFSPTVMGDRISLRVFPEVSELDYQNALELSGFTIPALTTRRASTVVELRNGQSFAIAGLLQDNIRETIDKYPGLGDVPVLGTLFRSSQFQKAESELVIIVTPYLAKPMDGTQVALPTDSYKEPTELEFLMHGKMEGDKSQTDAPRAASVKPVSQRISNGAASEVQPASGMEGDFGHILPAK